MFLECYPENTMLHTSNVAKISDAKISVPAKILLSFASVVLVVYGWTQKMTRIFTSADADRLQIKGVSEQCSVDEQLLAEKPVEGDRASLFISCGGFY